MNVLFIKLIFNKVYNVLCHWPLVINLGFPLSLINLLLSLITLIKRRLFAALQTYHILCLWSSLHMLLCVETSPHSLPIPACYIT